VYIERKRLELEQLDIQKTDSEASNREIMRDNINKMKDEVKIWVIDLLFRSAQNLKIRNR